MFFYFLLAVTALLAVIADACATIGLYRVNPILGIVCVFPIYFVAFVFFGGAVGLAYWVWTKLRRTLK